MGPAFAIISILVFIPAIVVHEVAHGYAALKMGDTTAKDAKRLSFNPLRHIDPFGTVILPLLLVLAGMPAFGYAKPVPYNPNNLKDLKKGELAVGLAGPASNLVMAVCGAAVGFGVYLFNGLAPDIVFWAMVVLYYFTLINLCLMFFNLLPIPPLDGSSIIMPLLPDKYIPAWYRLQRAAFPILIVLVVVLPRVFGMLGINFNPLSAYIEFTAGNLTELLFSFWD